MIHNHRNVMLGLVDIYFSQTNVAAKCNWPLSASTMTCYTPVFFLYFAMICL